MIKRVYLEITDACNLDCSFCTNNKGQSFMPVDNIKMCLDQIKEVTNYVYLHVLGEPLLHPYIEEILTYTDNINLNVQLVTNGTLLNKHLDILKHKSIRKLSISLHSINNIDIDNSYFDSIDYLIKNNESKNIELRFYNNQNLDTKLTNYLNKLKDEYGLKNTPKENSYRLVDNVYIYYSNMFDWPNINDDNISNNGKCHGGIDQLAILHNLKVTLCCLDPKGHNEIGDLSKETLIDIINKDEYKKVCDNFRNNKLTFELCKKCKYRTRFNK
ncbi:MAG: radical SAM protein [Erysipelotrichaceae bacterium]|nr:radical SAM protein [Erysipelotrichaceae bacterium]